MAEFRFGEIELNRLMLGDVTSLCRSHPFESVAIAINDVEAVTEFCEPEIEIGELASQLMTIQCAEFDELIGKSVSDINRVRECLASDAVCD